MRPKTSESLSLNLWIASRELSDIVFLSDNCPPKRNQIPSPTLTTASRTVPITLKTPDLNLFILFFVFSLRRDFSLSSPVNKSCIASPILLKNVRTSFTLFITSEDNPTAFSWFPVNRSESTANALSILDFIVSYIPLIFSEKSMAFLVSSSLRPSVNPAISPLRRAPIRVNIPIFFLPSSVSLPNRKSEIRPTNFLAFARIPGALPRLSSPSNVSDDQKFLSTSIPFGILLITNPTSFPRSPIRIPIGARTANSAPPRTLRTVVKPFPKFFLNESHVFLRLGLILSRAAFIELNAVAMFWKIAVFFIFSISPFQTEENVLTSFVESAAGFLSPKKIRKESAAPSIHLATGSKNF